ncbi:MAG: hypothetical protein JNL11_08340 [Bdellovibrionaceae bacterium]|nr:hypothetical protein [Pseudobdellovibrionaceae bacterium]
MKYQIQIPGKTFCFGEYAALVGGSALLITTEPGFEISFMETAERQVNPFHPRSPAGYFFEQNIDFFSQWRLFFKDNYSGRGGFGASTAQFAGLSLFKRHIETQLPANQLLKAVFQDYQQTNLNLNPELPSIQQPSGYDLQAQCHGGGLILVTKHQRELCSQEMDWPFPEHGFMIVPTGFKVATHTHLEALKGDLLHGLVDASKDLTRVWKNAKYGLFHDELVKWRGHLTSLNLVHPRTLELVRLLSEFPEVSLVKGCGALGADILFLVFMHRDQEKVRTILSEMHLNEAYDRHDLWKKEIQVQVTI